MCLLRMKLPYPPASGVGWMCEKSQARDRVCPFRIQDANNCRRAPLLPPSLPQFIRKCYFSGQARLGGYASDVVISQ